MRKMHGWSAASFHQFRTGYRNYPVDVLQEALAAPSYERMWDTLNVFAAVAAQKTMAKAFPVGKTTVVDAANDQVLEAKKQVTKVLGEDGRDLVFIPITPCTVWDTRFAGGAPFVGAIGDGVTRRFYSWYVGAGGSFAPYGGNPSCPETSQNSIGGMPYAVMMTVYVNNPVGQGWLTFYRDGDADPSQATISVYYSPGPTRTQTVISKSNRGYGTGTYDIAVTGRFGTADASAAITGYFIKPQATALDCTSVTSTSVVAAGARQTAVNSCAAGYTVVGGGVDTGTNDLQTMNASAPNGNGWFISLTNNGAASKTYTFYASCCRVPGRP